MSVKRKLILDVDTGIDDALALAYVSTFDDVELLGAIGTYGNVTADTAVRNTRYVLDWLGLRHVPVLAGSTHPSWADSFIADAGCAQFHGTDGLGGFGPAADPSTSDSAGAFTLTSRRLISVAATTCTTAMRILLPIRSRFHSPHATVQKARLPRRKAYDSSSTWSAGTAGTSQWRRPDR